MIDNGLKTVKQFFDGSKKFVVPEYQRAFAWEEKQLNEFFYDIYYQATNQKYFYGTILLNEKDDDDDDDFSILEIVDGQQRITTLIIFIKTILTHIKEIDPKYNINLKEEIFIKYHSVYKLIVNKYDNEFFQTYILNPDRNDPIIDTPSQRRLFFAKSYFKTLIKKENVNVDKCLEMMKIIEKAEVLIYSVTNSAEATLIFETTNDRGKKLTNLEKLKSFMMYKCFLANNKISENIIKNLYDRFGKIYQIIENLKELFEQHNINFVDEDTICRYHFIGYYKWAKKSDYQNDLDVLKNHINELLKKHKPKETIQFIDDYSISLLKFFDGFKSMLNTSDTSLQEIFYLEKVAVFYPILTKIYIRDTSKNKEHFRNITKILTHFSFRILSLKFKRTNDVDMFLNGAARDFDDKFRGLKLELEERIREAAPLKKFKNKLFSSSFYEDYSAATKNYFFWKYENYLRENKPAMPPIPIEVLSIEDEKLKPSIEHITSIAEEWSEKLEKKEIEHFNEIYLNSIGNLVLDSKSSNSAKGKKKWKIKNDEYYSKTPLKSQLELKEFLTTKKSWGAESINKRKESLTEFIESVFQ